MQNRPDGRGGRPWGPLRGTSPEAHALAGWLRDRVTQSGMTLQELAGVLPWGKDSISRNLNGQAVPPWRFVESLAVACSGQDRTARQLLRTKARDLWETATQAAANPPRTSGTTAVDPTASLVRELVTAVREADEHRREAQLAVQEGHAVIAGLMFVLGGFATAMNQLTLERDTLREKIAGERAARRELEETVTRLGSAEDRMAAADEKRRRAEDQLAEAETQLRRAVVLHEEAMRQHLRLRRLLADTDPRLAPPAAGDELALPQTLRDDPTLMGATDQALADGLLDRSQRLLTESSLRLDRLDRGLGNRATDPPPVIARRLSIVTPSRSILATVSEALFKPWECLAEIVDNSLNAVRSATASDRAERAVTVAITVPDVRVTDDGPGLDVSTLYRFAGQMRNGSDLDVALPLAVARLGTTVTIRTTRAGDTSWTAITMDLERPGAVSVGGLVTSTEPKADPRQHGTEVAVHGLHREAHESLSRPTSALTAKLGDVYSHPLGERTVRITVNGEEVTPRLPCTWSPMRSVVRSGRTIPAVITVDCVLAPLRVCVDCGSTEQRAGNVSCLSCGRRRVFEKPQRIWGWLGIQRYFHPTDYGIDFIRDGRKILFRDKSLFTWTDPDGIADPSVEYPVDPPPQGRIVGEIHCDHVPVNIAKNAFDDRGASWAQVVKALRGEGPLSPVIARRLGYARDDAPLQLLFDGFRRAGPGLTYLVPGDGRSAVHTKAIEWGRLFRAGVPEYQTDALWYEAAAQHDRG